jgi:predicted small lipoprotein YifL
MKKYALALVILALAGCGQRTPPAGSTQATNTASASKPATGPIITPDSVPRKAATYDPNLKPASTVVPISISAGTAAK